MGRIRIALAAGVAALALSITGCTGASTGASSGGSPGASGGGGGDGVLRIGATATIDSLNPFVSQSDYSSVAYQYMYPHLVEYDENLDLVPSFATSWDTSSDGKTWTFHTVSGATWSDGKPLTAKDAAFTLTMMVKFEDGPTGLLAGLVQHLKSATASDDTTLILSYDVPVANVLAQMQGVHIYPEQVWGPLATGDGSKITTFQNPVPIVSGGPFMMTKYTKNQLALFARNPNWWGSTQPHIDGFGFQFFANDDAMVTALKTGQLDMIGEATPPTAIDSLNSAGMKVMTGDSLTFMTFIINTNPKKKAHHELLDPKVREALEYATDRQQIIDTAWLGQAVPGASIVQPASGWNDPSIKPLPFDVAKANELLDAAGLTKGSDGIRVAPDGEKMSYDVVFPTEIAGTGDRTFQIIQSDFKQVGIELKQQRMDPDAAWTAIAGDDDKYQDFDLAMWDWVLPPDPQTVLAAMTCDQWGNLSDSGYCNPEFDKLYEKQSTLVDRDARAEVVNQMQQIVFDDRPYIVLNYPNIIEAHSPAWDGFVMSPLVGSVNNLSTQTLLAVHKVG
jgi:peptide/nickel transport system substrate-binding protein